MRLAVDVATTCLLVTAAIYEQLSGWESIMPTSLLWFLVGINVARWVYLPVHIPRRHTGALDAGRVKEE